MDWKQALLKNFNHWEKLADFLDLSPTQRERILKKPNFPLNLPLRLAERIAKGTLEDPILKQFLPTESENIKNEGFTLDPVQDHLFRRTPKLLHKYPGRLLIVCTGSCVVNCRFCFRKNYPYEKERKNFDEECTLIKNDPTIQEVILSGGDPLSLSDQVLGTLLQNLNTIPHVKRIRFHSRFPIGIPERISTGFLSLFDNFEKQVWFALHVNHPRELGEDLFYHLRMLQKRGIALISQTVLLRGINDDIYTLKELCEELVNNGVLPYYLHQMDRVSGASHFEVSEEEGKALVRALASQISGYAVPKYVKEIPGESSKTIIQ
jgi:EF-P beta-lysylation protein EpmB